MPSRLFGSSSWPRAWQASSQVLTQIDDLQSRLREAETYVEHLAIARKTVTTFPPLCHEKPDGPYWLRPFRADCRVDPEESHRVTAQGHSHSLAIAARTASGWRTEPGARPTGDDVG
ncbi:MULTISPECIES: hypothetical protein [Streptomyces]|uniref:Uncharacterized protein n=1 Tax=Streptomyces glycanivorans TaxID=3033808 RepID=A0ABY9JLN4_9ACTN|nr:MULTISPECIES: hypothetical protein [unclassified Streptomyces]WSQ82012.1 hypothetical protein OG725_35185 [Streptomyces sp. NBC_01213]WLQ68655.1 hypothetical protein P8A20_36175 [Streptomyces sp. Alt3]WSQ89339.1 hypothetical protein OG722_35580 [Streptomyces sp. NBC_01212]WSR04653.1 hypothetical protein OG265_00920 [Streptomyces sp. NBC_01208]WSR52731.1 hypothetical protein OG279_36175 [Streptomyces sp. NBC_01201]